MEIPRPVVRTPYDIETVGSMEQLGRIPLRKTEDGQVLVRDVAAIERGTMPGQYDRYNMKRQVTITANVSGADLGSVSTQVQEAIKRAGDAPQGSAVEIRGRSLRCKRWSRDCRLVLLLAIVARYSYC